MSRHVLLIFASILLAMLVAAPSSGAPLAASTTLVGQDSRSVERSFEATTAGQYQVQLVDAGLPAPLAQLRLVLTAGDAELARLDAAGTATFDLATPATVTVRVVGTPASGQTVGAFSVDIRQAGAGTPTFEFSSGIATPTAPAPGQATLDASFQVQQAGTFACALQDSGFPAQLSSLQMIITRGSDVLCNLQTGPGAPSVATTFAATPGEYTVFAIGRASATTDQGLFTIRVAPAAGGTPAYETAVRVGSLAAPTAIALAANGGHTLALSDLSFGPQDPLDRLAATLLRGSQVLATRVGQGSSPFTANAGAAQLYVSVATDDADGGFYSVDVSGPTGSVFSDSQAVPGPSSGTGVPGFQFATDLPAAGSYRLSLTDFQFLSGFSSIQTAVTQGADVLGTLSGAGTLDFTATAGRLNVVVLPALAASTAKSLFSLQIRNATTDAVVFERTQGVGGDFASTTFDVPASGSYDVRLSDLGFPVALDSVSLVVTRGVNRELLLFGPGQGAFDAIPGTYVVNVLATPGAGSFAGLYGVAVEASPPPPSITFSADPATVANGQTTTLTWSTQGADSCTASGGWSGSRATSGSETSVTLSTPTTFTLDCRGPGGTASSSVSVSIRSSGGGGGGGSMSPWFLLLLAALGLAGSPSRLYRQRRVFSAT